MRILVLNFEYPPMGGGGAVAAKEVSKKLVASGHKPVVVTLGHSKLSKYELINGVEVHRVWGNKRDFSRSTLLEVFLYLITGSLKLLYFKLFEKRSFDIIHAHFILPTGPLAYLASIIFSCPYVLTAQGSDVPNHSPDKVVFMHKFTPRIIRFLCKHAHSVTALSPFLKSTLLNTLDSKSVVHVVPSGIDTSGFLTNISMADKTKTIFTCSRLSSQKGVDKAIMAYKQIDSDLASDWVYKIAGNGCYEDKLKNLAATSPNAINFLGWVEYGSEIHANLYKHGAIMVLPTKIESFGIGILEAMYAKCAIICSNLPVIDYIAGDAVWQVDPEDINGITEALTTLMSNEKLRFEMGARAHERASKFSWEQITKKYMQHYKINP